MIPHDREDWGKIAYEAYRESINRTTDYGYAGYEPLRKWEDADHETQLAFRNAAEALARELGHVSS